MRRLHNVHFRCHTITLFTLYEWKLKKNPREGKIFEHKCN